MITKSNQMSRSTWDIGNYAIILLAGVGLFVSWRILQRYGRTTKLAMQKQTEAMAQSETALQLSEKSVLLAEESNKLLKEIIEVLKSKNRD
jgi:ATP-dependent Zn protease